MNGKDLIQNNNNNNNAPYKIEYEDENLEILLLEPQIREGISK